MSYNIINKLQESHIGRLHELYQMEWWTRGRTLEDVRAMVSSSEYLYGTMVWPASSALNKPT